MTKTSGFSFDLGKVRQFSTNTLPPEAADSPLVRFDAEYRRLLGLYDDAVAELRRLAERGPEAAESDRRALAQNMAAGKPDPGDRETAELHEQFVAQQRQVTGLADAVDAAYDELRRAIDEHADAWAASLAQDAQKASQRVDELLREVEATLARTDGACNAVLWLERALNLGHRRDVPSQRASSPSVHVGGGTMLDRAQVFNAIRACAVVPTPKRSRL